MMLVVVVRVVIVVMVVVKRIVTKVVDKVLMYGHTLEDLLPMMMMMKCRKTVG